MRKAKAKEQAKEKSPYVPVPIFVAQEIADKFSKSIVIILSHDPVYGLLHTTTYGVTPQDKAWAAKGGEIAARALGVVPGREVNFEDYRLTQARKLLATLKEAARMLENARVLGKNAAENQRRRAKVEGLGEVVREAERFL